MINIESLLKDRNLIQIKSFEGSVQILLDGGYELTIYHPIQTNPKINFKNVIGSKFNSFTETKDNIALSFKDWHLKINKSWDYGPEVMMLSGPNNLMVVWND